MKPKLSPAFVSASSTADNGALEFLLFISSLGRNVVNKSSPLTHRQKTKPVIQICVHFWAHFSVAYSITEQVLQCFRIGNLI